MFEYYSKKRLSTTITIVIIVEIKFKVVYETKL